jgi:hypothetical protein
LASGKEAVGLKVFDLQGRLIKSLEAQADQTLIIGADLKPGSYFIEVRQGKNRKITKVVKL